MKSSLTFCRALDRAVRMAPGVEPVISAISAISIPSVCRILSSDCCTDGSVASMESISAEASEAVMASSGAG